MNSCQTCGKKATDDLEKSYVNIFKNCLECDKIIQQNGGMSEKQLAERERLATEVHLENKFNL